MRQRIVGCVLWGTLLAIGMGTASASAPITVTATCSDVASITVSASALVGVEQALAQFNAHNPQGTTCTLS